MARALSGEQVRTETENGKLMLFARPIDIPDAEERVVVTRFFGFERNFHLFLHSNLLSVLITIPVVCIVFFFFSRRLTGRIREMNRAALNYTKGGFREQLKVRAKDEIGQLGRTLNYMADKLSSLERIFRRLSVKKSDVKKLGVKAGFPAMTGVHFLFGMGARMKPVGFVGHLSSARNPAFRGELHDETG